MANYKKIVLTGGPCAGKTTAEETVKKELTKLGYTVFFLSETATDLLKAGISPDSVGLFEFQKAIADLQLKKEAAFEQVLQNMPEDQQVILICDRGVIDNKAFCTDTNMFNRILYDLNLNEAYIRDNYDAVFHLRTAAYGAENFYGNETNPDRKENIEEARVADDKLLNAWTGHPHLRVITNDNKGIHEKLKELMQNITQFLGEPTPYEIERKFIIQKPDITYLESLPNCHKINIVQTYLKSNDGVERRVRQRMDGDHVTYYLTEKRPVKFMVRKEDERRISATEYASYLMEQDFTRHPIVKDRYCLLENNQYFEIDVYPFWENQAIMEIELTNENDPIHFPQSIQILTEVTGNKMYDNYHLSNCIPDELATIEADTDYETDL